MKRATLFALSFPEFLPRRRGFLSRWWQSLADAILAAMGQEPHDMVACGRAFAESYLSADEKAAREPSDEAVARELQAGCAHMTANAPDFCSLCATVAIVRAAVRAATTRAQEGR